MDDDNRCVVFAGIAFLTGIILGISAGLLLAPQTGSRTRRQLKNFVEDASERAEEFVQDTKETVSGMVERGKKFVR